VEPTAEGGYLFPVGAFRDVAVVRPDHDARLGVLHVPCDGLGHVMVARGEHTVLPCRRVEGAGHQVGGADEDPRVFQGLVRVVAGSRLLAVVRDEAGDLLGALHQRAIRVGA